MKKKPIASTIFLVLVLILMYLPIGMVALYSFNANPARNAVQFTGFTLQWYADLLADTRGFGLALWESVQLALYSCLLAGIIGTLGAIGMVQKQLYGRTGVISRVAQGLTTLPIMIPDLDQPDGETEPYIYAVADSLLDVVDIIKMQNGCR